MMNQNLQINESKLINYIKYLTALHKKFFILIICLSIVPIFLSSFFLFKLNQQNRLLETYEVNTGIVADTTHPHLLFNEGDVQTLLSRTNKGDMVQTVFNVMKYWPPIDPIKESRLWPQWLVDNSFHYAISKNETSKKISLNYFNKYTSTSSTSRYTFRTDPDNKNSTITQHCVALALAYDFLYPVLTDRQRLDSVDLLKSWAEGYYSLYNSGSWNYTHNFHVGAINCMGLIGLSLKGEVSQDLTDKWINFTLNKTHSVAQEFPNNYFNATFNPGGDSHEGPLYHYYGSGPSMIFAIAYQRHFGQNIITNKNITNVWDFFTYSLMPDKKYVRYGDNYNTTLNGESFYFLKDKTVASDPKLPGYLWTWQQIRGLDGAQIDYSFLWKVFDRMGIVMYYPQGVLAKSPDEIASFNTTKKFPSITIGNQGIPENPEMVGGMVNLRTGWSDTNNITLWLNNRWTWQSHQYYDPNHFLMYAYGQKLISHENNSGYDDIMRGQLSWHNTILINKDIYPYDCPSNTTEYSTSADSSLGLIKDLYSDQIADMVVSDSRYPHAYFNTQGILGYNTATTTKVKPIIQADRAVVLVKQGLDLPYTIMADLFQKNDLSNSYTWQAFFPALATNVYGDGTTSSPFHFSNNGVGLMMTFITPSQFTKAILPKHENREDKALQISQNNVVQGNFLSILFPYKGTKPAVTITSLNASNPTVASVKLNNKENIIIVNNNVLTNNGSLVSYGTYSTDAHLAVIAKEENQLKSYILIRGTKLVIDGNTIFSSTQPESKTANIADSQPNPNLNPSPNPTPIITPQATVIVTPVPTSTAEASPIALPVPAEEAKLAGASCSFTGIQTLILEQGASIQDSYISYYLNSAGIELKGCSSLTTVGDGIAPSDCQYLKTAFYNKNAQHRSLLKFDLSALRAQSNIKIDSASLILNTVKWDGVKETTNNLNIARLLKPYANTIANWNIYDSSKAWGAGGATKTIEPDPDYLLTASGITNFGASTTNISSLVLDWYKNSADNAIDLMLFNNKGMREYASSEYTKDIRLRPKLVVTYSCNSLLGDLNEDKAVNISDLNTLILNWYRYSINHLVSILSNWTG